MEYNNFKNLDAGNDKYGEPRLKIATYLRDNILNKLEQTWFIENGTLLGAYRDNKFIINDDDFDIGMLIDSKDEIKTIYKKILNLLPKYYKLRIIDTYCNKIEIYEPKYGSYILKGPHYNGDDYHYVSLDLQFYLKNKIKNNYHQLYFIFPYDIIINHDIIYPLKKIILENEESPTPNNVEEFLKLHYGSIDKKAKYNIKTHRYELTLR